MAKISEEEQIIPNWLLAEEIYSKLLETLRLVQYPYDQPKVRPPQIPEFLPKSLPLGSREHALFLFASCYQMSGIESDVAFNLLRGVYEENPHIFLPEYVVENDITPGTISDILDRHQLRYKSQVNGRAWIENSYKLHKHWGNDPRNLFIGTNSYDELADRIRNKKNTKTVGTPKEGMFGFQHKMVCMLAYFLTDADLVKVPYLFPVPVDFHHMRVHLATKMVVVSGRKSVRASKRLEKVIRNLSIWYCLNHDLPSSNPIADAVWLLSKYLCSQYPGNATTTGPRQKTVDGKVLRRSGKSRNKEVTWEPSQVAAYYRSCGSCPIDEFCKISIGAGQHYQKAQLVLRGPRETPPQAQLLPVHKKQVRVPRKLTAGTKSVSEPKSERRSFPLLHKRNMQPEP